MSNSLYRPIRVGGCLSATLQAQPDGSQILRATEPLAPYPKTLTERLEHWASIDPQRTLVARRDPSVPGGGDWLRIGFGEMLARARSIGQALVERGLSAERPLMVLSDNDLEHFSLAMGAMWAGVPYVPVSPAYSLVSSDHAKLRHIAARVTPGLVFASGPRFLPAIDAVFGDSSDVEVVLTEAEGTRATPFAKLLDTTPGAAIERAHAAVGPDTIAKLLFTSGSTKAPKGVINTQRMLCANQQMTAQSMCFLADGPLVMVDWLPWNHTFGGNQNMGLALFHGGTLYIDEGRPTAQGIATTLRNLREISPTVYFNVPRGFEEIVAAMAHDDALRASLFARVQAFMFAGAGLSQAVWDRLDRLGEQTAGCRIPIVTGLGMTETAPSCLFALRPERVRSGHVGLPCPGVEVRLVPDGAGAHAKTEIRYRGPHVTPGYWREPALTAEAFDAEGFFASGDAVRWIDPADIDAGLMFDGRIAEDFKLDSGTFVSVGPLRARIVAESAPLVQDAVLTGLNRAEVGALLIPRLDDCRQLAGLAADAPAAQVLSHPDVVARFQAVADRLWRAGTGSATRVARLHLMAEPPSIDRGEVTDKGSINQRAVLANRAALVEALHSGQGLEVILPRR